jgi:hypothetical protein
MGGRSPSSALERDGKTRIGGPGQVRSRVALVLLALAAIVALVTRLLPLTSSLGHDEALTALRYIAPGPMAMFTDYTPNDHLLFGLLTWASMQLLPSTEPVYRLWSVIPALAAIVVSTRWMWRRHGPAAGLVLAVAVTASPLVVERTGQARGYGLALLGMVVALMAAVRWEDGDQRRAPLWFATGATVAFCSFPLVALALVGHVLLLARAPERRGRLLRVLLPAAVVSGALYAPVAIDVVRDAAALVANPDVSWTLYRITNPGAGTADPDASLIVRVLGETSPAVPNHLPLVAALAGVAVGVSVATAALAFWWPRVRSTVLHSLLPAALLVGGVAVGTPYAPRFVVPVVVHLLVPVALSAAWLALRLRPRGVRLIVSGAAILAALATLGAAMHDVVLRVASPHDGYRSVADAVDDIGAERVYTTSVLALPGLLYYLGPDELTVISNGGRSGLPTEPGRALAGHVVTPEEFERVLCRRTGSVAVIEESATSELVDLPCVDSTEVRSVLPLGSDGVTHRVYVFPPRARS